MTQDKKPEVMLKFVIFYYGVENKKPDFFTEGDMQAFIEQIVYLAKKKALFSVYTLGKCIGDFS